MLGASTRRPEMAPKWKVEVSGGLYSCWLQSRLLTVFSELVFILDQVNSEAIQRYIRQWRNTLKDITCAVTLPSPSLPTPSNEL